MDSTCGSDAFSPSTERTQAGTSAVAFAVACAPGPATIVLRFLTDPKSGIVLSPGRTCPGLSEENVRLATVNASGSCASRRSWYGLRQRLPKRFLNACWSSALTSSPPFETVNCVTSRTASAAVSDTVHFAGVVPSAAYSAGIFVGSAFTSSMRWLIPST